MKKYTLMYESFGYIHKVFTWTNYKWNTSLKKLITFSEKVYDDFYGLRRAHRITDV